MGHWQEGHWFKHTDLRESKKERETETRSSIGKRGEGEASDLAERLYHMKSSTLGPYASPGGPGIQATVSKQRGQSRLNPEDFFSETKEVGKNKVAIVCHQVGSPGLSMQAPLTWQLYREPFQNPSHSHTHTHAHALAHAHTHTHTRTPPASSTDDSAGLIRHWCICLNWTLGEQKEYSVHTFALDRAPPRPAPRPPRPSRALRSKRADCEACDE